MFKLFPVLEYEYVVLLLFYWKSYDFPINFAILKMCCTSAVLLDIQTKHFSKESSSDVVMEVNEKNMIHKSAEALY